MSIRATITAIFQALLSVLVVASTAGKTSTINQHTCVDHEVVLECPAKDRTNPEAFKVLKWHKQTSQRQWTRLAEMDGANASSENGFVLHDNGSLRLPRGRAEGKETYKCDVREKNRRRERHFVHLRNIKCRITRDACLEDEVVLECPAKDRVNPEAFKVLKWHKETSEKQWTRLAEMDGVNARSENGFVLHENGSLRLPRGRAEGKETYKCDVRAKDGVKKERIFVELKNVKCRAATGTVKTTQGRVTMTTPTPTQHLDVSSSSRPITGHEASTTQLAPANLNISGGKVCGGVLNNTVGSFRSPNFPRAYPANSHCKWTISLPQDYAAINITLTKVNLEGEDNCQHDYIAIYDELENQIDCRICGIPIDLPIKVQVRGRTAVVVFKSDGSENKTGFQASYQAVVDNRHP